MAQVPLTVRVGRAAGVGIAAVGLLLATAAVADVRSGAGGATTAVTAPSWRSDRPMRLGVTDVAPRRNDLARQQTPQNNCRKWRRIAERLGETFAGLRLRQSVVDRACLFAATELANVTGAGGLETGFDHLWAWPWADGAIDATLPPRLHATHGDWQIRCGDAGRRERCALIHETVAMRAIEVASLAQLVAPQIGATQVGTPQAKVVTHFVIDTIGGHTHVVWRVFVERYDSLLLASNSETVSPRTEMLRFSSGTMAGAKRFDACSSVGCLMEADMTTSARFATRLWEGDRGELALTPGGDAPMTATISAKGLRAGLAELARLKRSEDKAYARN